MEKIITNFINEEVIYVCIHAHIYVYTPLGTEKQSVTVCVVLLLQLCDERGFRCNVWSLGGQDVPWHCDLFSLSVFCGFRVGGGYCWKKLRLPRRWNLSIESWPSSSILFAETIFFFCSIGDVNIKLVNSNEVLIISCLEKFPNSWINLFWKYEYATALDLQFYIRCIYVFREKCVHP